MPDKRAKRPFADELPDLLDKRGISLRALARSAGVNDAHLSRLLRGVGYRTRPSRDLAQRIAEALDLPHDYFTEYREAVVIDEIKRNPRLRDQLYARLKRSS